VVDAYEIEPALAQRATDNLAAFPNVMVHARSGAEGTLSACDVLYVNAGATEPLATWLDALSPMGRLLFPMTPDTGVGAMLLVTKQEDGTFTARFLLQAQFVPCFGARSEATEQKLAESFRNSNGLRSSHCIETMSRTRVAGAPAPAGGFRQIEQFSANASASHTC